MVSIFRSIIHKWHLNFLKRNYPINKINAVSFYRTIYVKKGKIREWRTYDTKGNRQPKPIFK